MFLVAFAVLLSVLTVLGFCLMIWGVDSSARTKGICLLGLAVLLMSAGVYQEHRENWRNQIWGVYREYQDRVAMYQRSKSHESDSLRIQMVRWSERYNELANDPLYGWTKERYLPQRVLVAYD